jgi:hypothetical protein
MTGAAMQLEFWQRDKQNNLLPITGEKKMAGHTIGRHMLGTFHI